MKYNITKSDITEQKQIIEILDRGIDKFQAIFNLSEQHGIQSCDMFQDIERIKMNKYGLYYFDVVKNGRIIRYEIEEDRNLSTMALVSKGYDFCWN